MTGALVILAAMVVIGLLLFITDVTYYRHKHPSPEEIEKKRETLKSGSAGITDPSQESAHGEICCGQHLVCEKTTLSIVTDEVIYYDDEELDRFSGRSPESYTNEETEEFRDILLTLLPEDVAGWAKSITLRNIELPFEVKDELLMLVSEQRNLQ